MPSHQVRFITACQQLLALAVVLALLTPAASILSLEVVAQAPATAGAAAPSAMLSSATVPSEAVDPKVTEYSLTATPVRREGNGDGRPGFSAGMAVANEATVTAPVAGYGAVGVTWSPESEVAEGALTLQVRSRDGEGWSEWTDLEYHDDHAPDAGSPDAASARPGTDALIVGEVDEVQVRAEGAGVLPQDLSVAVVDPGEADDTVQEAPELAGAADSQAAQTSESAAGASAEAAESGAIVLSAASKKAVAQPTIYSRAQWGADESIRDKGSLRYGTISAGFVHHTVNANDYTADQVPAILRSIYAYHVKSRGWSDIGYNFLVDRFGRIWEGRFGGIDKPVVGAHTLGYNDYAFAMSAIGNFELVQPSAEMIAAYGQLFAWKLSLHGVNPASTAQTVGKKVFAAINGHRDAGSTACPGKHLYAKIPAIRAAAAGATQSSPVTPAPTTWSEAPLKSNLVGSAHPDLVVRRAADGRGLILPTGGLAAFSSTTTLFGSGFADKSSVLVSGDLTGDGIGDLVVASRTGVVKIRPGTGTGTFARSVRTVKSAKGTRSLTAVGDINGDGRQDLVALVRGSRAAVAFLGTEKHGFTKVGLGRSWGRYAKLIGVGDIDSDGRPDLLGRDKDGQMWMRQGAGGAAFRKAHKAPGAWSAYNHVAGGQDLTGDGRTDLVARRRTGSVFILPGLGDQTFGYPIGPLANVPNLNSLTAIQVAGTPAPDLVARRGDSLVLVPNRGTFDLGAPIDTGADLSGSNVLLNVGDWDRDGFGDVITREGNGDLVLRRGNGQGQLAAPVVVGTGWGQHTGIEPVGDVSGDGYPDLMATPAGAPAQLYRGQGAGAFLLPVPATGLTAVAARLAGKSSPKFNLAPYDWAIGISDAQLGSRTDLVVRHAKTGRLYLVNGTAKGLKGRRYLGSGMGVYNLAG